jgi:hypothetical protein
MKLSKVPTSRKRREKWGTQIDITHTHRTHIDR